MSKLVDHFGTKYFAVHYNGELQRYLATQQVLDIADARLCRETMQSVMTAASNGLEVHDSLDPEREALFAENRRRKELQAKVGTRIPLPIPRYKEKVLPLIKDLDPSKHYLLWDGSSQTALAFACLVQAARPEIKLDLGSYVAEMLAMVYNNLYPSSHRWDEFYVLVGNTFVVKSPLPGEYHTFLQNNLAVPTVFGAECLYNKEEWGRCLERITRILEKGLSFNKRKIADYL